ncbi:MAG: hypothetical protein FWC83_00950, partial [Alphaproteobacteria bacterium]|nr:hypothetical protein [Alphaproteobacteria bacterium]
YFSVRPEHTNCCPTGDFDSKGNCCYHGIKNERCIIPGAYNHIVTLANGTLYCIGGAINAEGHCNGQLALIDGNNQYITGIDNAWPRFPVRKYFRIAPGSGGGAPVYCTWNYTTGWPIGAPTGCFVPDNFIIRQN